MADPKVQILIGAKNGAKQVFRDLASDATAAGKAIDTAGKDGAQGLKQVDPAARQAAKAVDTVGDAAKSANVDMQALGAGLTTIGAGMIYASNKAMEQERQLIGLRRAYGDTAEEMIQFAEDLDNITMFSDDDIRAGERFFASLKNNYDLSTEQIKELMRATADLASSAGVFFEEASNRVTAAIRGEGEAAEYLGLTMNQQSIDRDNLTLSMTNQEAAQFRYNALLEQSAVYQGTANEMMNASAGTIAEWRDQVDDAAASVGTFIGPVGTLVTGMGTLGIGMAGLTTGFGLFNSSIKTVRTSMATGLLAGAFTPMGLAVGGLTLGIGLLTGAFIQNQKQAAEAQQVIATLKDEYLNLKVAADEAGDSGDLATEARLNQLRHQVESVRAESDLIVQTMEDSSQFKLFGKDYDRDDWFDLKDAYEITDKEAQSLADSQAKLGLALQDSTIDAAALSAAQGDLYNQFIRQEITADQFIMQMADLAANTDKYTLATDDATRAQQAWNAAMADGMISARDLGTIANVAVNSLDNLRRGYRDAREGADEAGAATRDLDQVLAAATARGIAGFVYGTRQAADEAEHLRKVTTGFSIGEGFLENATAEAEEYAEWLTTVAENMRSLLDVSGFGGFDVVMTEARVFAAELNNVAAGLESVFRVVVGNTDGIANQVDGVYTWAKELINVEGEYGKIDDLRKKGLVTEEEYVDAQRAYNVIGLANAQIQDDVLAIQAKQAPLIADQTNAMAEYMRQVRQMPADQQLITLGWMDSATAARAMEFQTLAVAAATGQLGENGEAVFTDMIIGAANADPVLKALLIDMGLISEGADGTITVNLSGVEGARSELGQLTDVMVALIDIMDNGELDGSFSIAAEDNASPIIRHVRDERDDLDGSSATVSIYANDYASLGINAAGAALTLLNGREAVTTVRTRYVTEGLGPGKALGGVVQDYASGGVVIRAGEIGPEIAHFATGGTALIPSDGYYSVPAGTYISPNNAVSNSYGGPSITVNVHVAGGVVAERDLTHSIARAISAELQGAAEENWGGYA